MKRWGMAALVALALMSRPVAAQEEATTVECAVAVDEEGWSEVWCRLSDDSLRPYYGCIWGQCGRIRWRDGTLEVVPVEEEPPLVS